MYWPINQTNTWQKTKHTLYQQLLTFTKDIQLCLANIWLQFNPERKKIQCTIFTVTYPRTTFIYSPNHYNIRIPPQTVASRGVCPTLFHIVTKRPLSKNTANNNTINLKTTQFLLSILAKSQNNFKQCFTQIVLTQHPSVISEVKQNKDQVSQCLTHSYLYWFGIDRD